MNGQRRQTWVLRATIALLIALLLCLLGWLGHSLLVRIEAGHHDFAMLATHAAIKEYVEHNAVWQQS